MNIYSDLGYSHLTTRPLPIKFVNYIKTRTLTKTFSQNAHNWAKKYLWDDIAKEQEKFLQGSSKTMNQPKVSIIMPAYKGEKYLRCFKPDF